MLLQSSIPSSSATSSQCQQQNQIDALATLLLSRLMEQSHQQPHSAPQSAVSPLLSTSALPTLASMAKPVPQNSESAPLATITSANKTASALERVGVSDKTAATESIPSPKSSSASKRKAFLNKRSRASGAIYRPADKKQNTSSIDCAPTTPTKSGYSRVTVRLPRDKNAFVLNESFHPGDTLDLLLPWKLHDLLDNAEKDESIKSAISWNEDGASFRIHDEIKFSDGIMFKHFKEEDWDSFVQTLSSWGFVRFTSGTQQGSFIHRLLAKGKRSLCKQMRIRGKTVRMMWLDHIVTDFIVSPFFFDSYFNSGLGAHSKSQSVFGETSCLLAICHEERNVVGCVMVERRKEFHHS